MRIKTAVACVICMGMALPGFAQRNILKPIAKGMLASPDRVISSSHTSFEQALRAGGLAYMVSNKRVGAEALRRGVSSSVGTVRPTFKSNLKCKAYEICSRHLEPAKVDALVERQLVQEPFPAYYTSFPKVWSKFQEKVGGKLGTLEVILEAAYGPEPQFDGAFVNTYREVVLLSKQPVEQGVEAAEALARAYSQGMERESGFFMIRVQATQQHPQDVLLLDMKDVQNVEWISMRQSVGGEWMDTYWMEETVK